MLKADSGRVPYHVSEVPGTDICLDDQFLSCRANPNKIA